jgi:hypothetical protein
MPPGEVIAPASLYKIFGRNMEILLAINASLSAAAGAIIFLAGSVFWQSRCAALLFALGFFFGSPLYHYAGYNHSNWFLFFLSIALYWATRYMQNRNKRHLAFLGVYIGAASLFRLYETIPFAVGICAAITTEAIHKKEIIKKVMVFLMGIFVLWSLVAALFFFPNIKVALDGIMIESVAHAASFYSQHVPRSFEDIYGDIEGIKKNVYSEKNLISTWRISYYAASLMRHVCIYILILWGIVAIGRLLRHAPRERRYAIIWIGLWAGATTIKGVEGIESGVLSFASIPTLMALVSAYKWETARALRYIAGIIVGFFILVSAYIVIGEQIFKIVFTIYPVKSSGGTLYTADKQWAKETEIAIKEVDAITEPNDYIAVIHKGPYPFFAATGRRNATRYDSLIDLIYRPSAEKEYAACRDIREKARIIIADTNIMKSDTTLSIIRTCIKESFDVGSVYTNYALYYSKLAR